MTEVKILYADRQLAVAVKPGGMLAVPGRGAAKQECLSAVMRRHFADMPAQPAVHRLDMATSGLMLFARTREAHRRLCRQFEQRLIHKGYEAVVEGEVAKSSGEIRLAFRLDVNNRPRQIHDPVRGKTGITRWRRLEVCGKRSRLHLQPQTGRTHQLRVHCAHPLGLGCPIVGDFLYGSGADGERMLLHATEITFFHPQSGAKMYFQSPAPF